MSEKGLMHVYYGDGKGKTSAALGLAVRAAGCGKKVVIIQFIKGWKCGEHESLSKITNIKLIKSKPASSKFIHDMTEDEKSETKIIQDESLRKALALVEENRCDVLILDEAVDACNLGVLDVELIEDLITEKPEALELVITGHKADDRFIKRADYVTEMKKHKHPYDEGIKARRGIEF